MPDQRAAARGASQRTIPWDYGKKFMAHLGVEGIAASTPYILVDLSDAANFPHTGVNAIILGRLKVHVEKATDGVYDIWVGVVTQSTTTTGRADWFHAFHLEAVGNPTDSTDRFVQDVNFGDGGLNLNVLNGVPEFIVTNQNQQGGTASNWQSDVYRTTPAGSAFPGVGDLVVWVEEVSGTGTLDLDISAEYDTL